MAASVTVQLKGSVNTIPPPHGPEGRRDAILSLFNAYDLDGNGAIGLHELQQLAQAIQRNGASKRHVKIIRSVEAQIRQANETNRKTGIASSVSLKTGGTVSFAHVDGEPSLDPTAFVNILSDLTHDDTDDEFAVFIETSQNAVADAYDRAFGSKIRRTVWSIFQLIDANSDGFIDMSELEDMLLIESKNDRKTVTKWKLVLSQKKLESQALPETGAPETPPRSISPGGGAAAFPSSAAQPNTDDIRLTLSDFQGFIQQYCEGDEEKILELDKTVAEHMRQKHQQYINSMKVNEIMDCVLEDLLRERPVDVLAGIIRSCERMQRTGRFPRGLTRVHSVVRVDMPRRLSTQRTESPTMASPLETTTS